MHQTLAIAIDRDGSSWRNITETLLDCQCLSLVVWNPSESEPTGDPYSVPCLTPFENKALQIFYPQSTFFSLWNTDWITYNFPHIRQVFSPISFSCWSSVCSLDHTFFGGILMNLNNYIGSAKTSYCLDDWSPRHVIWWSEHMYRPTKHVWSVIWWVWYISVWIVEKLVRWDLLRSYTTRKWFCFHNGRCANAYSIVRIMSPWRWCKNTLSHSHVIGLISCLFLFSSWLELRSGRFLRT